MNKRFISFIIFFLCFAFANSQNSIDSAKSNVRGIIKFYPLQLISGEVRASYEKKITNSISLDLNAGYIYGISPFEFNEDFQSLDVSYNNYTGFAFRLGIKTFTSKYKDQYGFNITPLLLYKYYKERNTFDNNVQQIGFQLLVGYKSNVLKRFTLEPYIGFGFKRIYDNYNLHDPALPYNLNKGTYIHENFTFQFGFSIGYLFLK